MGSLGNAVHFHLCKESQFCPVWGFCFPFKTAGQSALSKLGQKTRRDLELERLSKHFQPKLTTPPTLQCLQKKNLYTLADPHLYLGCKNKLWTCVFVYTLAAECLEYAQCIVV